MNEEQVLEVVKRALAEDRMRIAGAIMSLSMDFRQRHDGEEEPDFDHFIMQLSDAVRGE